MPMLKPYADSGDDGNPSRVVTIARTPGGAGQSGTSHDAGTSATVVSGRSILAQRIQQVAQVLRRFGVESQRFARDRVGERKVFGMQGLAPEAA